MKTTISKNTIEAQAVAFRTDPLGANRTHCDTWEIMGALGGGIAICYGLYMAIPWHHKSKRRKAAERIARLLEDYANEN